MESLEELESKVSQSLERLRREPINADGSQDAILTPIYTYLIAVPPGEDRVLHWFCSKSKPVAVEAATFLLRLHAYSNNPRIDSWKDKLAKVLHGCCACVQSYTEIKVTCRNTYFAAFSKSTLDGFFAVIDKWEVNIILDAMSTAGVVSGANKSVSDAPPAVLYHILVSMHLLDEPKILALLREHPPCIQGTKWPNEIPPGLLLLLFHESGEIRTWAQQQLSGRHPLKLEQFTDPYELVFRSVVTALTSGTRTLDTNHKPSFSKRTLSNFFTMSTNQLWSSLQVFLRWIPDNLLAVRRPLFEMFRQTVIGHLHDQASHFPDVLRAFIFLLVKYGKYIWDEEKDDFPQIVFDAIKDNTAFLSLVQTIPPDSSQIPWVLKWFHPYLASFNDMPRFEQALKKVTGLACEELQHERFQDRRPVVMTCILQAINSMFRTQKREGRQVISQVFDMYAPVIIEVAVSPKKNDLSWHQARESAHRLLSQIINDGFANIERTLFHLSKVIQETSADTSTPPSHLNVLARHDAFWKQVYTTFVGDDKEVMELLIVSVGLTALFDNLNADAYNPSSFPSNIRISLAPVVSSLNAGLSDARSGFLDAVTRFTDLSSNSSNVIQNLLSSESVLKNIITLLLSPIEELQTASQILVGRAYDVDIRSECFRALLERHFGLSLHALTSVLESFVELARILPEACGLAKTLVRCMTDVIEVLTNGHDGLFLNKTFCESSADVCRSSLPRFWQAMCQSITTIFRRTPTWSRVIDADAMIDWMRDALIFARDLLAQWRTFEKAALADSSQSSTGPPQTSSLIAKQILNDMQNILTESIRWLRLTDLELLHQSATLVQSLLKCFQSVNLQPSDDAVKKLEKFLEGARRVSTPLALRTRLSEAHISELASLLASLTRDDDDDDIQILENPNVLSIESTRRDQSTVSKASINKSKGVVREGVVSSTSGRSAHLSAIPLPTRPNQLSGIRQSDSGAKVSVSTSKQTIPVKNEAKAVKVSESSSESEASDEEETGGLASLSKLQKSPAIKKTMERRGIKMMEPVFNGNNAALERIRKREEAQRALLRMKPDLKPLYRLILSWHYDHEGSEPPSSGKREAYTAIPDNFRSGENYQSILEPLLTLECWSQLVKSKQEAIETLTARINSRQYVDDFLELDISITERIPDKWRLSETDIVLLRNSDKTKSILSKVQASRRMPTEVQATLHCLTDANGVSQGLHINSQWKLSRVFSLSTISREFAALKGLPYYDFYAEIMNPRLLKIPDIPHAQIQRAKSAYLVNEPQAIAILSALKMEGFTLIQGPPGTGKTWTICGIVGAFLSSRPRPATIIQAGRSNISEKTPPSKVLVCAPSNAAIDEVAKRLQDGVRTSDGELVIPKVVRVGAEDSMNISVQDISLDRLVDQRLNGTTKITANSSSHSSTMMSLRAEMDSTRDAQASKRQELSVVLENIPRRTVLEEELKGLNNKRMMLSQQYNRLKDQQQAESRTLDAARRKFRAEVLQEADVICSTLSGSGHEVLESVEFDTIVIDEAAQAVELSSLIPLKYRAKRCVMVGDPQQLPPTVLSPLATKYRYNQSLFVRLQKSMPEAVHLLSIQYRMHPDISRLPSKLFYNERLLDGPDMAGKTAQPWHTNPLFGSYKFINVTKGGEQSAQNGHSLVNIQECDIAVALYNNLRKQYSKVDFSFRIGVIAMYRAQLVELKRRFKSFFGPDILTNVDFNTVDGFQGQEKDIIILSCVRAGPGITSIGFLSDHRRLNVAITRARSSLFILGHAATLSRSDNVWRTIVEEARSSGALIEGDTSTFQRSTLIVPTKSSPETTPSKRKVAGSSKVVESQSIMEIDNASTVKPPLKPASKEIGPSQDQFLPPLISPSRKRPRSPTASSSEPAPQKALALPVNDISEPPKLPPPPRMKKKQPKEVSMFIPKKNPNAKRPAPETESSNQQRAKRRILDEFRPG